MYVYLIISLLSEKWCYIERSINNKLVQVLIELSGAIVLKLGVNILQIEFFWVEA